MSIEADHSSEESIDQWLIFGAYGQVMLQFQLLELTLWQFLLRSIKDGTSLDQAMTKVEKWDGTTLGQMFRGLKNQAHWPETLIDELAGAIDTRNYLAHHFLREYFMVTPSEANREQGAERLAEVSTRLEALEESLEEHLRSLGVDTSKLASDAESMRPTTWPLA